MTMLLENRTISMILTVPNVKELSHSVENLNTFSKNPKPPSIPIYHGSILHIEQHRDNQNTSDLIVRVPNFRHLSLPSVTISINDDQLRETENQRQAQIKRRAPICPILNDSHNQHKTDNSNLNQTEINSRLTNTKRLAIGLRNLRRTIIANCKSKRSTNINELTIIPVLPDVEVITANLQGPRLAKKINKNSTSKFLTSKILFIKRKHFKIKKKQPSDNSIDIQTDTEYKTYENSGIDIDVKDNEIEQPIKRNPEVEQQTTTITQLIPKIPISLINPEFSSDPPTNKTEDLPSTNILQPNTFISNKKIDLTTDIQSLDHFDDENIEEGLYVVHPNGDTYSECYEVTYEFDPEYQHFIDNKKEQIYLPAIQDQPSIKLNLDSFEYQDLTSALATWLPVFPSNDYEQIDQPHPRDPNLEHFEQEPTITRVKFQSLEDLSQTSHDQTSTYQPESISGFSSSQENNQIMFLNDTPIINEDYTVILQLLKRVLQIETTSDDDYNEFNKEINQRFQTDKINELE